MPKYPPSEERSSPSVMTRPMGKPLLVLKKSPLSPATTRQPCSSRALAAAETLRHWVRLSPKVTMGVTALEGE